MTNSNKVIISLPVYAIIAVVLVLFIGSVGYTIGINTSQSDFYESGWHKGYTECQGSMQIDQYCVNMCKIDTYIRGELNVTG